ncbi:Ldh family oxidoreductase [Paenarthrobacter sp. DKR-5]|uniref:Ldh family oxidoreductase n=1 Tax=Paenarthrobacter sp. DKR-5 TaxID=2835535 RepID=UPI001BDCA761|nr:Ldh family oxidoreductase [Paenarthrobacter sp. DKR-5]MBT1002019.1 Ldh family oxidoreductase [Paenarthrobacter sp. DKR-5]
MNDPHNIQARALLDLCAGILRNNGLTDRDAHIVANSLVDADLRGVSSHGVLRMETYLQRLNNRVMNATPEVKVFNETAATAVLDGDNGFGQVVSQRAVDVLLAKTKDTPIAAVSVRNSNHFGAAAYWAAQLAEQDLIGVAVSNVEPLMPPPGGAEARIGNNPLSVVVPAQTHRPIVVDMATSVVPLGKILNAKSKGEPIPEGWGLDSDGKPTTVPDEVINGGSLFPVGGPKGYGLAVIVEVLSALLSGGEFGTDIHSMYQELESPNRISHFFMAIKISAFLDPQIFKTSVDRYIDQIKSSPLAPGNDAIYMPGEIELKAKDTNMANGISLPPSVAAGLLTLAKKADVSEELIRSL